MADEPPDERLMQAIVEGDHDAFASLVARHIDLVHHFALRAGNNAADADELAQECFLRVWQRAAEFDPQRGRCTTWLLGITRNLSADRYRATQRRPEGHLLEQAQTNGTAATATLPAPGVDPADAFARQRQLANLRQAIARLPERQRTALTLCQLQGRSNAEAAAVLDVSVAALESLLARGRRTLQQALRAPRPVPQEHV